MSSVIETIEYSIRQTDECQKNARQSIKWNFQLVGIVESLLEENSLLKQKLEEMEICRK